MAAIALDIPIHLHAGAPVWTSPRVPIDPLTSDIIVRLQRPTPLNSLAWDVTGRVRVRICMHLDAMVAEYVGEATGGERIGLDGRPIPFYALQVQPTIMFGQKARDYIAVMPRQPDGSYLNVPLTRLSELATSPAVSVVLEWLAGDVQTIIAAEWLSGEVPILARYSNSVAFDAQTTVSEAFGDGVVSLTHTANGVDRAAFITVGHSTTTGASYTATATYGGVAASELWDIQFNTNRASAAYSFVAPPTSATTVTATLSGSTNLHTVFLGVISMTGVDQTTPIGTPTQYTTGTDVAASRTPAGVASGDLVVDMLVSGASPTIGPDQTLRNTGDSGSPLYYRTSTQPGTVSPAEMSWTFTGGASWNLAHLGAVAFKATTGAPTASLVIPQHPMQPLLVR